MCCLGCPRRLICNKIWGKKSVEKLRVFLEALMINTKPNPKVGENEWMHFLKKNHFHINISCVRMIVSLVACYGFSAATIALTLHPIITLILFSSGRCQKRQRAPAYLLMGPLD